MPDDTPTSNAAQFRTTQWGLVSLAASNGPESFDALSELCRNYWYPLYAYLRRSGQTHPAAEDLTQAFFERLLAKPWLERADAARGRFRTFLLTSLKNFVINEHRRDAAQRRGGAKCVSWEGLSPEARYQFEPVDQLTPDKLFERRWAMTVLELAFARLREELAEPVRRKLFDALKPALIGGDSLPYAAIAAELGVSESAIKVTVHRLRQRFRATLKDVVADTLASPENVDDEIRQLIAAL